MKTADNLPEHWRQWLEQNYPSGLKSGDFQQHVMMHFEDSSTAIFHYAITARDDEREEVAVFTEHCGYHVFVDRGVTVFEYSHGSVTHKRPEA